MYRSEKNLVSVIIPCYRQAHFLGEAIESVLNQTYRCFEIIVVDDGSPDGVREVVASYPKVRYIRQTNQGVSAARNCGLRESVGNYLVFLDADDRLLSYALEAGACALERCPEAAFAWGQCKNISPDGWPLETRRKPKIERDHYLEFLRTNYIRTTAAVMYRRAIFEVVGGFDASLRGGEEYELHLRIAKNFPIYCHDRVVAEYRIHPASAMGCSVLMLKDTLRALRRQFPLIKGDKEYEQAYRSGIRAWKSMYGSRLMLELKQHLKNHDWGRSLNILGALVRYYPEGCVRHMGRKLFPYAWRLRNLGHRY